MVRYKRVTRNACTMASVRCGFLCCKRRGLGKLGQDGSLYYGEMVQLQRLEEKQRGLSDWRAGCSRTLRAERRWMGRLGFCCSGLVGLCKPIGRWWMESRIRSGVMEPVARSEERCVVFACESQRYDNWDQVA